MSEQPTNDHQGQGSADTPEVDAERVDPEHASADLAGDTPPHADAEEMESALREGGPLVEEDEGAVTTRREASTEDGPGTSLT